MEFDMELNPTTIELHPAELAYGFANARAGAIIGWGKEPFLPAAGDAAADWLAQGAQRLRESGRLTGSADAGFNLSGDMVRIILALASPSLVLLAQRKAGDGMRLMTVHVRDDDYVGLSRRTDGLFEVSLYANLTSACAACASFVGAPLAERPFHTKVEIPPEAAAALLKAMAAGQAGDVAAQATRLGLPQSESGALAAALGAPASAGVVSALYIQGEAVADTDTYSVFAGTPDNCWVLVPLGGPEAPLVIERTSLAALAARIGVATIARLSVQA